MQPGSHSSPISPSLHSFCGTQLIVSGANDARGQVHLCWPVVPAGRQDGGRGGHRGGRQEGSAGGDRTGDGSLHHSPRWVLLLSNHCKPYTSGNSQ